jgi:hypothetical protein
MTAHPIRYLSILATAALLAASAVPAAAQRHGGGGGGGGHAGGGAAHVSAPHGGGGVRASGGAHVSRGSRGSVHVSHGSRGTVHVRRSGTTARSHTTVHTRKATRTTTSGRRATTSNQTRNQTRRDRAAATARQNRERRAATAQHARETRAARAARTAHIREARRGRFGARYYANARATRAARIAYRPARWAWRHRWRAGWVGWYGPIFWPYAYADIFGYAFWPWGYDPAYWDYAYDGFFDGVYYGDVGPGPEYGSASYTSQASASRKPATETAVTQLCKQPGDGITAWPTAEINSKVQLTDEQKPLFDDLQNAGKQAADDFAASCPAANNFAATPPGRLQAMTARLEATLKAVETVKPPLDKFYASLSDEQKERFNEIGPKESKAAVASRKRAETQGSAPSEQSTCGDPKPGLTNLPIEQIRDSVKPTDAQQDSLKALEDATNKAVSTLQAACPDQTPMTPTGRLDAMETRLKAMVEAANTVKPALDDFYGSLSDEQKARFNRLGRTLSAEED